jgi:hypothetical protein
MKHVALVSTIRVNIDVSPTKRRGEERKPSFVFLCLHSYCNTLRDLLENLNITPSVQVKNRRNQVPATTASTWAVADEKCGTFGWFGWGDVG